VVVSASPINLNSSVDSKSKVELSALKENTKLLNYFYKLAPDEDYDGKYFPDYYGGSYIEENGQLIIMLKNGQGKAKVESIINNVNFVSCNYSYAELVNSLNFINERISQLKNDDRIKWFSGMELDDKGNTLIVYMRKLNDESIKWFRNNVADKPYIKLKKQVQEPVDEVNYSGQGVSTSSAYFSGAFRVIRYTTTGARYGFITCAHGNDLFDTVFGYDGASIGTVQLRQYAGNMDASYVEMTNSSNFTNVIYGSPYTLNNENDDLYYPTVGSVVWLHGRSNLSSSGIVQSTNISYTINGIAFSGLYGANYTSASGDSGGLICSSPVNYACNPTGIHKGTYNGMRVFTSAIKVINGFYFLRY
jgi:streptogrisin B